jgi:hypothetical protein
MRVTQKEEVMKRHFAQLLLVGLAALTASAADVTTDYDHSADFSQYHTYSWLSVKAGDQLWADRIQQAVDAQLAAKGWTKVASGGDAMIAAFGRTDTKQTLQTFYDGFPGWYWSGFGTATTTVEDIKVGTLVVDIFDARTKKLIWRGRSTETLSGKPEKNEKKLEKSVEEMFKHFPPKGRE